MLLDDQVLKLLIYIVIKSFKNCPCLLNVRWGLVYDNIALQWNSFCPPTILNYTTTGNQACYWDQFWEWFLVFLCNSSHSLLHFPEKITFWNFRSLHVCLCAPVCWWTEDSDCTSWTKRPSNKHYEYYQRSRPNTEAWPWNVISVCYFSCWAVTCF